MDLDMPAARIRSIRGFLAHIATVTLGILIAFSFEGARGWWQERSLVREAERNLLSELRDNRRDLHHTLRAIERTNGQIERSLRQLERRAAELENAGPKETDEISDGLTTFTLFFRETSWSTAETTGALGHMKYAKVEGFAELYGMQREFRRGLERFQDHAVGILPRRLSRLSLADVESRRETLLVARQHLVGLEFIASALDGWYRKRLGPG
jgi:hypothetical protein